MSILGPKFLETHIFSKLNLKHNAMTLVSLLPFGAPGKTSKRHMAKQSPENKRKFSLEPKPTLSKHRGTHSYSKRQTNKDKQD